MIAALAICLTATAAVAQDRWRGCYTRLYDAAHLKKNPRQKIESLSVKIEVGLEDAGYALYAAIVRGTVIGFPGKTYSHGGYCRKEDEFVIGALEEDGGEIRLTPTDSGVRLENPNGFFLQDDDADFEEGVVTEGHYVEADTDHKVFILMKADASACD